MAEEEDIFEEEEALTRPELRKELKECVEPIPKTGGKKFRSEERVKLEREVFGGKYGGEISEADWKKALQELKALKSKTKEPAERRIIDERFRFLKKIGPK